MGQVGHRVHRVVDDDNAGVRRGLDDLLDIRGCDVRIDLEQVFTAHAGLTGSARGQNDDIGVLGLGVVVGADDVDVESFDRSRFQEVKPLALRDTLDDVDQYDIRKLFGSDPMRTCRANETGANDSHFLAHSSSPDYQEYTVGRVRSLNGRAAWASAPAVEPQYGHNAQVRSIVRSQCGHRRRSSVMQ